MLTQSQLTSFQNSSLDKISTDQVLMQIQNHLKQNIQQPVFGGGSSQKSNFDNQNTNYLSSLNSSVEKKTIDLTGTPNYQNMIDNCSPKDLFNNKENIMKTQNILLIDDLIQPMPQMYARNSIDSTDCQQLLNEFKIPTHQSNNDMDKNNNIRNQSQQIFFQIQSLLEEFRVLNMKYSQKLNSCSALDRQEVSQKIELISNNIYYIQYEVNNIKSQDICEQIGQISARQIMIQSLKAQHQTLSEELDKYQDELSIKTKIDQQQQQNQYANFTTNPITNSNLSLQQNDINGDESELKKRLNQIIVLCKKLNPSDSQPQSSKFAMLKQTLGIQQESKPNQQDYINKSVGDIIFDIEEELKVMCEGFERRDQTRQDINQKMIQAVKQQQFKEQMALKYEFEQKLVSQRQESEEKFIQQLDHMRRSSQNINETSEILHLNQEIDRLQNMINQNLNEISYLKQNMGHLVNEKAHQIEANLLKESEIKEQTRLKEIESDMKIIKLEWKNKNKTLKADYEKQLRQKEQEIKELKDMISQNEKYQKQENELVGDMKLQEEEKYEKRIALIKKMHDEQVQELKRVISERENEIETKIIIFNKQKDDLYQKAKQDAIKEEKIKTDKYLSKIERIKQQELAMSKRQQRSTINELKDQISQIAQQLDLYAKANPYQQAQMINSILSPEQSFNPLQNPSHPGLDLQNLKDSVGQLTNQIKEIDRDTGKYARNEERSQASRSQNRLEKYKQSMLGTSGKKGGLNESLSRERPLFQSKLNLTQKVDFDVSNQSILVDKQRDKSEINNKTFMDSQNILEEVIEVTKVQGIQCILGAQFFETLDLRVCMRCGLNDKIQPGQCNFHPFKCHHKSGSGKYMYSPQWHQCRENCVHDSKEKTGCITLDQHYYGTHLPYMESVETERKRQKSLQRKSFMSTKDDKEVMTEVSLLFNPFKKTSQPNSSRSPRPSEKSYHSRKRSTSSTSSNPQYMSQRRSSKHNHYSQVSNVKSSTHSKSSVSKTKPSYLEQSNYQTYVRLPEDRESIQSSPLTTSKLQVTAPDQKYSSRIHESSHPDNASYSQRSKKTQNALAVVSPFKDQLENYIQSMASQTDRLDSYNSMSSNGMKYQTNSFNTATQVKCEKAFDSNDNMMIQSRYLKTDQDQKQSSTQKKIHKSSTIMIQSDVSQSDRRNSSRHSKI
ncbi:UNKNOWN [Stylonychia lemnae]|uniref:Uncharacterized protein n=1 Tax=Stylonychia lemnae TaxID=5949 RepID=A0A078AIE0_STYLE|nr:UNKNOWN [Stylonychia lemnae]|eukprot:CDW80578.1 UNKNOWN [Stylonychia lemnae]